MGSILVSPAFNPEIVLGNSNQFRNAASTSQLESDLASVKEALKRAEETLTEATENYNTAVDARDRYIINGRKIANFSDNILTDYDQLYLNNYRKWYDAGQQEGETRMVNLINEIVLNRKYKKDTWGDAVVPGTLYKKKNLYDRVYNNKSQFNRYRFQQDEVVRAFIVRLLAEKDAYDKEVKRYNQDVIPPLKAAMDEAQRTFNKQQELVTKTATDLQTARNLPEMTRIANDAATAAAKIAADADVEKARILAQSETTRARNRTLILGGAAVAVIGIGAYLFLRR